MFKACDGFRCAILAAGLAAAALAPMPAQSREQTIYAFSGGADGANPRGTLVRGPNGALYGTTPYGGNKSCQCGVVFRVAHDGSETVLHAFTGGADGTNPQGNLVTDDSGNLYGTTQSGGRSCPWITCGTVFKLAPDGTKSTLYAFAGGKKDGALPEAGLLLYKDRLYGTTAAGGPRNSGTVFQVTTSGAETVLYFFMNGSDGGEPDATLIRDVAGNLYGTTYRGGSYCGCGIVFRLSRPGRLTVLHAFLGGTDGAYPQGGLTLDAAGNLYGTAAEGGSRYAGLVFKIAPDGTESILHDFRGGRDGAYPASTLALGPEGNLYGTTEIGGIEGCYNLEGCGTVFRLSPAGEENILYRFTGGDDGDTPSAGLLLSAGGVLYGTSTSYGNIHYGNVFKIKN